MVLKVVVVKELGKSLLQELLTRVVKYPTRIDYTFYLAHFVERKVKFDDGFSFHNTNGFNGLYWQAVRRSVPTARKGEPLSLSENPRDRDS